MKTHFRHLAFHGRFHSGAAAGALALMLIGGCEWASAQIGSTPPEIQDGTVGRGDPVGAPLRLSETQKSAIAEAVRRANKAVEPPPSFVAQVGAPVPPAIELHLLPDEVLASVPAAKNVKYTVVKNQLVLVDPTTMRVVDVIPQ
jgi:uncharacterized protein DUF1236